MKNTKAIIGVISILILIIGIVAYYNTDSKSEKHIFSSRDELKSYYKTVDIIEYENKEYAFCELKADQISDENYYQSVSELVEYNGQVILEPVEEDLITKLFEVYIKGQFEK